MKNIILWFIQIYFRIVQMISTKAAAKLAMRFFFTPQRTSRRHFDIFDSANVEYVPFDSKFKLEKPGSFYTKYTWGESGPVVILVHGWAGKATHYKRFIELLVEKGFKVIAFDAPAHGRSDGSMTNLPEFAQIVEEIASKEDKIVSIVGHSLGGIASSLAITQGLSVERLFVIASPLNMDLIWSEFSRSIPINAKTKAHINRFLEEFSGLPVDYFSLDHIIHRFETPITAIYDTTDPQAAYDDMKYLQEETGRFELLKTENLGHQKILFDDDVIHHVISEIEQYKMETV